MKIAIFHNLPSGGAKRVLFDMVGRLSLGHNLDVYSFSTANHEFCDLRPYVDNYFIHYLKVDPLFESPFGRLNQLQRWNTLMRVHQVSELVAKKIDQVGYDLIYVQPCMWTQAPSILSFLNTCSVYHIHESLRIAYEPEISRPYINRGWREKTDQIDPLIKLFRNKQRRMDYQNTRKAKYLLANSRYTAENVRLIYGREAKPVYFGIDQKKFYPIPGIQTEQFILSVGAIQPSKGFDFIIDALSYIPPERRPALHLIGNAKDNREKLFLEQLAKDKQVSLTIETRVTDDVLIQRYNQASLLVYAPVREPFGLVPLEAMACGKAVIGVNEGGLCETVIDGETGQLVNRDPQIFAEAVAELLDNPGLAADFGRRGREWVCKAWTWDRSVSNLERIFQNFQTA